MRTTSGISGRNKKRKVKSHDAQVYEVQKNQQEGRFPVYGGRLFFSVFSRATPKKQSEKMRALFFLFFRKTSSAFINIR